MITVNANFTRRNPERRIPKYQNKIVRGIQLGRFTEEDWESRDEDTQTLIRLEIGKRHPPGIGWSLSGFVLVRGK